MRSVGWHLSLPLINSFNKTEAVVFPCRLCFLWAFPFLSLNYTWYWTIIDIKRRKFAAPQVSLCPFIKKDNAFYHLYHISVTWKVCFSSLFVYITIVFFSCRPPTRITPSYWNHLEISSTILWLCQSKHLGR